MQAGKTVEATLPANLKMGPIGPFWTVIGSETRMDTGAEWQTPSFATMRSSVRSRLAPPNFQALAEGWFQRHRVLCRGLCRNPFHLCISFVPAWSPILTARLRGHVICYLNRTYHVLPTPSFKTVDTVNELD